MSITFGGKQVIPGPIPASQISIELPNISDNEVAGMVPLQAATRLTVPVETLKQAFAAGEDIHNRTARELFGSEDRDARARAKTINFAILYGISRWGLAKRLEVDAFVSRPGTRVAELDLAPASDLEHWRIAYAYYAAAGLYADFGDESDTANWCDAGADD